MTSDRTGSTPYVHVCLAYDDPAVLDARAVAFLGDGLAAGERVWLAGAGPPDALARRLDRLPGLPDALRRGAARLVPLEQAYRSGAPIDPETPLRAYVAATEEALAAGYTGLRVVADVTPLVRTAAPGAGVIALGGELDPSNHRLFADALVRADPRPVDGRLVVDATRLRFIDHRCLLHLRDHVRRHRAVAVLRTCRSAAARLVELLNLPEVRIPAAR